MTTPSATSIRPGPQCRQSCAVFRAREATHRADRLMIILSLVLIGIIGWLFLVNGEYLCLDRRPWWGPPEDPDVYTSCSGHIDELLHK